MAPERRANTAKVANSQDKVLDQPSFKSNPTRKTRPRTCPAASDVVLVIDDNVSKTQPESDTSCEAIYAVTPSLDEIEELEKVIEARYNALESAADSVEARIPQVQDVIRRIEADHLHVPGGIACSDACMEQKVTKIEAAVCDVYDMRDVFQTVDRLESQLIGTEEEIQQKVAQDGPLDNMDDTVLKIHLTYLVAADERYKRAEKKLHRLYTQLDRFYTLLNDRLPAKR